MDTAPTGRCVVCARKHPGGDNVPGWVYLASSVPIGAMTCSEKCLRTALDRWKKTGRVDTKIVSN